MPPQWKTYITVANADEAAKRAVEMGGTQLMPPFDVMDAGRMAGMQDPTGADFFVWQPKKHQGTGIAEVPGTLCWADLSTPEPERAGRFYSELFGWKLAPGEGKTDDKGYLHIQNGEAATMTAVSPLGTDNSANTTPPLPSTSNRNPRSSALGQYDRASGRSPRRAMYAASSEPAIVHRRPPISIGGSASRLTRIPR